MSWRGNKFRITLNLCGEFTGHQRISTKGSNVAAFLLLLDLTSCQTNIRVADDLTVVTLLYPEFIRGTFSWTLSASLRYPLHEYRLRLGTKCWIIHSLWRIRFKMSFVTPPGQQGHRIPLQNQWFYENSLTSSLCHSKGNREMVTFIISSWPTLKYHLEHKECFLCILCWAWV